MVSGFVVTNSGFLRTGGCIHGHCALRQHITNTWALYIKAMYHTYMGTVHQGNASHIKGPIDLEYN